MLYWTFEKSSVVSDASEHARELFLAGDRYDVTDLKKVAKCELIHALDVDNVADVLVMFDSFDFESEGLEATAIKLVPFIYH